MLCVGVCYLLVGTGLRLITWLHVVVPVGIYLLMTAGFQGDDDMSMG